MARVLTAARATVRPSDREAYLGAIARLAAHHRAHGGHFWLFEARDDRGSFLEFAEAADVPVAPPPALAARLAALAARAPGHDARWDEVPLGDHDGGR